MSYENELDKLEKILDLTDSFENKDVLLVFLQGLIAEIEDEK